MASPSPAPPPLSSFPSSSAFPSAQLLLLSSSPSPFLCYSSHPSSPSLSDQLLPLSLSLLKDPPSPLPPARAPAPTWLNPSKPRPSVLSLRRQRRPSSPRAPPSKLLSSLSRAIAALPLPPDPDNCDLSPLRDLLPDPPSRDDALTILNSLRPWPHAFRFFRFLRSHDAFRSDTIFYNVTMKSLRLGRRYDLVEKLAVEMANSGVEMDNVTYSTVITCAKRSRQFDRAIEWFERMYKAGPVPDEVTYSAVLDVYAQLGKVEEVMGLFERARASGWTPDPVAFAVLGRMFGNAGDYDGIQYVLGEMRNLGVEPNLVVYNTLIKATGKAGKPGLARKLFDEMLQSEITPNEKTLTAMIKIYGKARWSRDALELWERMRANNWPMDFILYNTLLSMCADLGLEEEAERLFADMKRSGSESERCKPDSWSYTAMVNIYASAGKVEKALELFVEMLESGVEPNIMSCTCLMQCFGKARRMDDVVRVFDVLIERGIKPDDRLCGCLLSVAAFCDEGEMGKILGCLERANPRLVRFIEMLRDDQIKLNAVKDEFRRILTEAALEVRRPFCNCLIDICRNQNFPARRARELFRLGTVHGLYPHLHTEAPSEWSLNVRSLSVGAAYTAFEEWMRTLAGNSNRGDALPQLFSIHTGTGSHKLSSGLASSFASHIAKLSAPFQQNEESSGCFVATREDLVPWIQTRAAMLAAGA